MELSEAAIAELKSKYGNELIAVTAPNGSELVFRKPPKAVWVEFVDTVGRDKASRYSCNERLVLSCVVHPSTTEAASVLNEYPAFSQYVGGELATLAGAGDSDVYEVKKL